MGYLDAVIIAEGKRQVFISVRRYNFNGTAVVFVKRPLYDIKHMRAPVGHVSPAEGLIIAPSPPKIISRRGKEFMIVLLVKVGTQPKIPIQIVRNRFGWQAIRSRRAAYIHFSFLYISYISIANQFNGLPKFLPGALHASGLKYPLMIAGRLHHRPALPDSQRKGFLDRKSTRLNSSHVASSYAVFCLKKKNTS